jgi:hypothetical protein
MKIKFFFPIVILAASLSSCKKTYTCECKSTITFPGSLTGGDSEDIKADAKKVSYSQKMSEKQAKATCEHEQETLKSTIHNTTTENGTQPQMLIVKAECELK